MRVLHIDTGKQMRGGQWQTWFLMEGLRERGQECVLAAPPGSPLAERTRQAGIAVVPAGCLRVWREARGCSLIHAHTGRAHTLAAVAGVRPLVVSRRVAFPVRSGPGSRWKYRRADRYLAVSEHVKEKLLDADLDSRRIAVVPDGVPLLEPVAAGKRLIAVDSDDPRKATALAKTAAREAGYRLELVTDLREALRDAAALVYLTEMEGLGSGVLMAMSAGVPVIASRVGGLPEIVVDGDTGLLVENNLASVAGTISKLMETPALRLELGRRGRQLVERSFMVDHMVEGTWKVYLEVAS